MSGFGNYDRLCEVQAPDNIRGSSGSVKRRWSTLFSFFASKHEQGSRTFQAADVSNVDVSAIFETHYNPQIKARQRFRCDGTTYEIVGKPREIGRREGMQIDAQTLPE